jgi:dihydroorotase
MHILFKNIQVVNEGLVKELDVLVEHDRIVRIGQGISSKTAQIYDGRGKWLFPGIIDGQVHFREPGATQKGDLLTESMAAVAGGVTSFIDMPNTKPPVLDMETLNQKYELAAQKSLANFGFLMGVNAQNLDQISDFQHEPLLGLTDDGLYFNGPGNLLAEQSENLEKLFSTTNHLVALHAEWESDIHKREKLMTQLYGREIPIELHGFIRADAFCYKATAQAVDLANKYNARIHILHLTSGMETDLFNGHTPIESKRITTEVCVQNLWFSDLDYVRLGTRIKWNPSIKSTKDREQLWEALLDDRIDMIVTDHAPHTMREKDQPYLQSLSGAPMVQHGFLLMLECYHQGKIPLETIVQKMCHAPAIIYGLKERGFIREGYYADLVVVNPNEPWTVKPGNILSKCGWSPLEGQQLKSSIELTMVNGQMAYQSGQFSSKATGMPLFRK